MDERIIGSNIRTLREHAGLTLTALAAEADLSKSTLSKIETGQVSAPISTLLRIAEALHLPLAEFFSEPGVDPPYVLTRKGAGPIITRDGSRFGYAYEALAPEMPRKRAEPFLLTIQPGDPVGEFRHGGQEFIYMLAGRLAFTVGNDELVLRPGDALYFNPRQVHTTRVVSKTPARFLCLFIQDEAAAHHSAAPSAPSRSRP
ncbi:helix-turn-helix domain-containing protein [Phycisphaerales bacterium AB-hyl4]|uniref:Helix-turn-helix domain-containing protein n=1 Tax=Natronomicrosphaera hydrolytica TaxID=3242702 RepID=A0ABV4UAU7_9BACT